MGVRRAEFCRPSFLKRALAFGRGRWYNRGSVNAPYGGEGGAAVIYIENDARDPAFNQALEEYVFERVAPDETLLMLWRNAPAVVCGCYQNAFAEVDMLRAAERGVKVIRRISGGGTVYHDPGNVNYSVIAPADDRVDYARFIAPVVEALNDLGIPAAMNRTCDIAVNGLKVSGSAQKTAKGRVLHHGTLLYDTDLRALHALADGRRGKFTSKGIQSTPWPVTNMRACLTDAPDTAEFMARLRERLAGNAETLRLDESALEDVRALAAEKYETWDWTFARSPAFSCETEFSMDGARVGLSYAARRGVIETIAFDTARPALDEAARRLTGKRLTIEDIRASLEGLDGLETLYRALL